MFVRQRLAKSAVFLLLLGMLSTFYPIRNASDQLNNKEASAYGSTYVNYLSLGDFSTCAITNSGGVKCWGNNDGGQLGRTGLGQYSTSLVDVTDLTSGASAVSINGMFACALTSTNGVKCWGNNSSGQLGNGTLTTSRVPVDVSGLTSGVSEISTGSSHSCAVTTSGGVKCWGSNSNGQLGNGTTTNSSTAVDVTGLSSGVEAVATGSAYSCALTTAGGVKCWGSGANGQIGNGSFSDQTTPVDASGLTSGVSRVAAGLWHVCAAMTSGSVKCWGENQYKQLGNNSTTDSNTPIEVSGLTGVSGVAAGGYSSCALKDGGVKCWGRNDSGQLGNKTTVDSATPVSVHTSSSDSTPLSGVSEIATGTTHACALMAVGDLKCWGGNDSGQLGRGNLTVNETTPANVVGGLSFGADTSSPSFSAAAVNSAGTQLILQYSEVLSATTASASSFAVTVSGVSRLVSSVAVAGSTVVLTLASAVSHGQVATVAYTDPSGGNDASAVQDASGNDAASLSSTSVGGSNGLRQALISAGYYHTCAVTSSGGVKCWGSQGTSGQHGDGTRSMATSPVQVTGLTSGVTAVATYGTHSCAITSSGGVKCWGDNSYRQLGDGSTASYQLTPVQVTGLTSGVTAVTAGLYHTCALLSSGAVNCWGDNGYGQLGDGSTTARTAPTQVSGLTSGVTAISAGENHTCALLATGAVKCWGNNLQGKLGDGSTTDRLTPTQVSGLDSGVTAITTGDFHTCALLATGAVKCWGYNYAGQLGDGSTTTRNTPTQVSGLSSGVAAIAIASDHSCALLATGAMKCWGTGTYGKIGDGTSASRTTPTQVSGLDNGVAAITTGRWHTCALLATGAIKCWGLNGGRLGDGTTTDRSTPVDVVGGLSFGADTSSPSFSAAAVNSAGTQLILQYSEALSATTSSASDFAVTVAGATRSVSSVAVAGSTIVLTLSSAVTMGQSVTVAYTDPSGGDDANAVQDASGNDAASLSATSANNHTVGSQNLMSVGTTHSCALTPGGGAKCWGLAGSGRLGNGQGTGNYTSPVDVSGLTNAVAIDGGTAHTCALTSSGGVKCWGSNMFGENGTGSARTTPTDVTGLTSGVAAISAGGWTSCALMVNGGVKCWGRNSNGQLGDGTTTDRSTPVDVVTSSTDSSPLRGVTAVSAAFAFSDDTSHVCALMVNGGVKCWGFNTFGALGDGTTTSKSAPVNVVTSGTDQSQNLLSGISAISAGKHMTCAVTNSGTAKCWGVSWPNSNSTTLGNGTEPTEVVPNGSGHKLGSKWPVDVLSSGTPSSSPVTLTGVSAVSVGYHHTCARMSSGGVKCWGNGWNGDGAIAYRTTPVNVLTSGTNPNQNVLSGATAVSVGEYLTCVLFDTGAIQCWGQNGSGSVGDGTTTQRLNPVDVVGGFSFGADATAPTFVSAATSANGSTITLTYSEALSATTASASAFSVVVGGSSRSVSSAVVSGSTVVLTLASAVGSGQSVTVAYTDPSGSNDANAVQDSAGNDAASLSATSVTNNVPQPSSGGAAPTNGTTTSTSSTTTTTTTIARGPVAGTTTTTAPRRPRSTSTTVLNRTTTTIRATTTTTSTSVAPTSTTTSSTTTTSIAPATITSVASSAIQTLQQAEEKLKTVEAQTSAVTNDLRAAQIQVGESRVAVLDPKSALVVAVSVAEGRVASLSAAKASNAEIAAAVTQLEDLKIAIAQNVTISIEKIATAQAKLAAVLSDPSASAKQVAEAKAELVSARVPTVEVVAAILDSVTTDAHLAPVIIPGVVDNAGSGQIVFLDGSIEKKVEIVRINGSAIRMTSTDGFTLNISTRDKDGQPLQFNSRGGIVVKHGNFISISGEGFAPGTLAKTWLFSSPRELGNLNVSTDGSFAADLPITDDIRVGLHVAQVDGLSPDGEVRSLSLDVEILPSEGQAEYDPIAKRLAVAALIAQAMALLALSRRREDNEGDDDREQADVSEVSIDQVVGSGGTKSDVYSPPVIRSIDGLLQQIPSRIASTQQLLARIIRDGVYLRALTGVGGVAVAFSGVIIGFFAANSSGFDSVSPSFGWLLALVILGSLDALAGGMAALTIIAVTALSGGIDSTDAIRGLLGLAVLSFAIPLVASTTRPFRRNSAKSENWLWTRTSDAVLLSLFGAWAAGAMYDALPGLYGFTSSAAGRTTTVQVVVLATLIVRFMFEGVATKVTGNRLAYLAGPSLPEPSAGRSVFAIIVCTAIMLFVAEAFIGNNFALWIGAAMYAIPKLIALVAHRFPKSAKLKVWLPAGLLRTVVLLFVARWWASNISSLSEDPATQLQAAFVLLGIPSLVLTSLGWFAAAERKWRSTPVSKVLGIVVLAIGVLTVRGVLFA